MSVTIELKKYSFGISGDCRHWFVMFSDSTKPEFEFITRSFVSKHPELLKLAQHFGNIQLPMKWSVGQWYYEPKSKNDDPRVFFTNRMLAAAFCAACHEYFNFEFTTNFDGIQQILMEYNKLG